MAAILKGIYQNGVIEPLTPFKIKEGTTVAIVVDAHRVEYLLIGGYAVGYHGYPRATANPS